MGLMQEQVELAVVPVHFAICSPVQLPIWALLCWYEFQRLQTAAMANLGLVFLCMRCGTVHLVLVRIVTGLMTCHFRLTEVWTCKE
jgi:hypothetical protein